MINSSQLYRNRRIQFSCLAISFQYIRCQCTSPAIIQWPVSALGTEQNESPTRPLNAAAIIWIVKVSLGTRSQEKCHPAAVYLLAHLPSASSSLVYLTRCGNAILGRSHCSVRAFDRLSRPAKVSCLSVRGMDSWEAWIGRCSRRGRYRTLDSSGAVHRLESIRSLGGAVVQPTNSFRFVLQPAHWQINMYISIYAPSPLDAFFAAWNKLMWEESIWQIDGTKLDRGKMRGLFTFWGSCLVW